MDENLVKDLMTIKGLEELGINTFEKVQKLWMGKKNLKEKRKNR